LIATMLSRLCSRMPAMKGCAVGRRLPVAQFPCHPQQPCQQPPNSWQHHACHLLMAPTRMHVATHAAQDPMQMLQGVMAELRADPVLRKTLDSPRVQRAMQELRADPARAMAKYAGDTEVMAVVQRLVAMGVKEGGAGGPTYSPDFFADLQPAASASTSGSSGAAASRQHGHERSSASSSPADLASQLFSDPRLAAKLAQPKIRVALAEIRANPAAGMAKWESDPEVCEVLDMLESAMGGNAVIDV